MWKLSLLLLVAPLWAHVMALKDSGNYFGGKAGLNTAPSDSLNFDLAPLLGSHITGALPEVRDAFGSTNHVADPITGQTFTGPPFDFDLGPFRWSQHFLDSGGGNDPLWEGLPLDAAAVINDTYSVKDYGADSTGAADSKPAFDAACTQIAANGGGNLWVPTGIYRYDSSSSFSDTETFCKETSNVTIYGDGPTASVISFTGAKGLVLGLGRADMNRLCTTPPNTGCSTPAYGLPAYYLFNNVSSGWSITMTTPSDASNFTAGSIVFLESGDASPGTGHPPVHFEYNQVVSANATTGVVVFKNQLSASYDSSQWPYVPMIAKIAVVQNVTVRDLGFTSNHVSSVILNTEGTLNTTIDNCNFTAVSGGEPEVWNSYSWQTLIKNSTFSGVKGDLGDAGAYWTFTRNKINNTTSTWSGSGAGRDWIFDGNDVTSSSIFILGSSSYQFRRAQITNNKFHLDNAGAFPSGAVTAYSDSAVITGNLCDGYAARGNSGACVTLLTGAANTEISNNVTNNSTLATGILLQSGASGAKIHDNQLNQNATGISIQSGASSNSIGCNKYIGTGSNVSDSGTSTTYSCPPVL